MKHSMKILGIAILLFTTQGFAQITTRWTQHQGTSTYFSNGNSGKEFMRYSTSGIYVGVDNAQFFEPSVGPVKLYKYATDCGELIWTHTYTSGSSETKLVEITTDASNNAYLLIRVGPTGNSTMVLQKVSSAGALVWTKNYGGGYPIGTNVEPTGLAINNSNGDIYLCGRTKPAGPGQQYQFLMVSYTSAGVLSSATTHQFTYQQDDTFNIPEDIIVDGTNAYIGGRIWYAGPGWSPHGTGAVVRIPLAGGARSEFYASPNGIIDWVTNLGFDNSGEVICIGGSFLTKLNKTNLVQSWSSAYFLSGGAGGNLGFRDFAIDGSNNIFGVYYHISLSSPYHSYISTVKINNSTGLKFSTAWPVNYFINNQNYGQTVSISIDPSNNVYVGGGTFESAPSGHSGYALLKYNNSTAAEIWRRQYYFGTNESQIYHIKAISDNTVFMTGMSGSNQTTMKIIPTVPAQAACGGGNDDRPASGGIKMSEIKLFPNPTNTELNISISNIPADEKVRIIVTGVLGNLVYDKTFQSNEPIQVNTSTFAIGTYFIKVSSNSINKIEEIQVNR